MTAGAEEHPSVFEQIGGAPVMRKIVASFYAGVSADPVLSPMYPQDDMEGAEERLRMFLEQYWGGPTTYSELRGHPRLRMRHAPYHINPEARDRWLSHMRTAVESAALSPLHEATLMEYFDRAAHSMVNTFD